MTGIVFDLKEFGLHDGKGMRTTVFMKGCPLHCMWCHNPEGISPRREIVRNLNRCLGCGLCSRGCTHKECEGFDYCVKVCPYRYISIAGKEYTPETLAAELLKNRSFLEQGGVTFSGGEPLMQGEFVFETIKLLEGISTAVETCGFVPKATFARAIETFDVIYIDMKLMDPEVHRHYTGQSNDLILENVAQLMESGREFIVRIPLIPGVNDTDENLRATAAFLAPAKERVQVELLPYNPMTGAKYKNVGKEYAPTFDEKRKANKNTAVFTECGIRCMAY
jgi:pyruvate formate lyase activating enzyme